SVSNTLCRAILFFQAEDGIENDRAASGQSKQAAHARSAKVKPLHATLARRALLRLDSMAAPDPHSMGVPRPQFPRLCPACLPRYPIQTILRQVLINFARKRGLGTSSSSSGNGCDIDSHSRREKELALQ